MSNVSHDLERKVICGKLHVKVKCISCKGMCWTAVCNAAKECRERYKCVTCTKPLLTNTYGRGTNRDMMEDGRG
jgi:hypothetical protein